jgi:hypothetical protein
MQPIANPSESVSARRRGETSWRSQLAIFRFVNSQDFSANPLTMSMLPSTYSE